MWLRSLNLNVYCFCQVIICPVFFELNCHHVRCRQGRILLCRGADMAYHMGTWHRSFLFSIGPDRGSSCWWTERGPVCKRLCSVCAAKRGRGICQQSAAVDGAAACKAQQSLNKNGLKSHELASIIMPTSIVACAALGPIDQYMRFWNTYSIIRPCVDHS